jgi:mono/diheme cytochrome c family protein
MLNRAGICVGAFFCALAAGLGGQAPQGRGQPGNIGPRPGVGPADRPPVDAAAATRGRAVWAAECITCHGSQARGTEQGPSVIRSQVFLTDRFGNQIGPFLKKGHPMQSGRPATALTDAEVTDLSHFLRERMHDTLRGSPVFKEGDILTGDAKAGAAYFSGGGKCSTCHSAAANNLAGIGGRYEPVDLQQRMLFPGGGRGGRGRGASAASAVTVTVTPASGESITGVLVQMDDLVVTLRDASGAQRIIRRSPGVKVVKNDPLKAHHELLETITDKNIHDLVAYLGSLK